MFLNIDLYRSDSTLPPRTPLTINNLPDEVLGHTLDLAVHAPFDYSLITENHLASCNRIVKLLVVCKRWYEVMISTPRIWCEVGSAMSNQGLDLWLSRAKSVPLSVFSPHRLGQDPARLFNCSPQWHYVMLLIPGTTSGWGGLRAMSTILPNLTSAKTWIHPLNGDHASSGTIAIETPHLRNLSANGPIMFTRCAELRSLHISEFYAELWHNLLDCIGSAPQLGRLEILWAEEDPSNVIQGGSVDSPSLQSLTLGSVHLKTALVILSSISTPSLNHLDVSLAPSWSTVRTYNHAIQIPSLKSVKIDTQWRGHPMLTGHLARDARVLLEQITPGRRVDLELGPSLFVSRGEAQRVEGEALRAWMAKHHSLTMSRSSFGTPSAETE